MTNAFLNVEQNSPVESDKLASRVRTGRKTDKHDLRIFVGRGSRGQEVLGDADNTFLTSSSLTGLKLLSGVPENSDLASAACGG